MNRPHVYMLTWCSHIDLLLGSTLTFGTLRDGFPNSLLYVVDSASVPPARAEIKKLSGTVNAKFVQLDSQLQLGAFIEGVLRKQGTGCAVFVDPDVCFWQPVEDWEFQGLAAGRYVPLHECEYMRCLSAPRLHTSLFWIPDVAKLLAEIRQVRGYFQPFMSLMTCVDGRWRHFDTAAGLYSANPDKMQAFEEKHFEAFDHLFAGTYSDKVLDKLGPGSRARYEQLYCNVRQDYRLLKGAWRQQSKYFEDRAKLAQSNAPV